MSRLTFKLIISLNLRVKKSFVTINILADNFLKKIWIEYQSQKFQLKKIFDSIIKDLFATPSVIERLHSPQSSKESGKRGVVKNP